MKTLQLNGLDHYSGVKTKGNCVQRGQVITVNDADAEYMTREENAEVIKGVETPHWSVVPNGTKADFHFATEAPTESEEELAANAATAAKADEAPAPRARGGKVTQRAPRARK